MGYALLGQLFEERPSPIPASPVGFIQHVVTENSVQHLLYQSSSHNKMATATKIHISSKTDTGIYSTGVREDAAQTASEVLQEDMAIHHVYLNDQGHHSMSIYYVPLLIRSSVRFPCQRMYVSLTLVTDHIVHHILTIYALGGAPEDITAAYKRNKIYQRPALPSNEGVIRKSTTRPSSRNISEKKRIIRISWLTSSVKSMRKALGMCSNSTCLRWISGQRVWWCGYMPVCL